MTTFGGSTIPPIFGGGAAQGVIFLRGVGDVFETNNLDGHPNTNIPQPSIVVGDQLYVFATGVGAVPSSGVDWTSVVAFGGSLVFWARVADGTASDEFTVSAAFTGMSNCQMASFGNLNQLGLTGLLAGTLTSNSANDWNIVGIAAGAVNDTLVIAACMRTIATFQVGITETDNTGLTLIGADSRADGTRTIWDLWSFRFDAVPASTVSVEQSYTPDPVTATQLLRYMRFVST